MSDGFYPGMIISAIIAFCILMWIVKAREDYWKDDAIKHGKAEYYLDEKHERQWRWLP